MKYPISFENTFGSFLRQKRQEKNLTQKELSKLLFVSESTVSKWEKDVAHPDITLLPKLSEILSVSEHELITASVDNKAREEKNQALARYRRKCGQTVKENDNPTDKGSYEF